MELATRFTKEFELRTPIAQAGMAFVGSGPDLAIAVSEAGGLGSLGVGLMSAAMLADTVEAVKKGTERPVNVNLITIFTVPDQIEVIAAAGVAAASFHWGHPPRAWIDQLHSAGVRVLEQVGSVDAALWAVDDGVDVVVAQGSEAGGHNYATLPTFALVPLVVDAVAPALVLAAGGIADGRGLAAALMLGADGAWVGTRLVATEESAAHQGYKDRLVLAGATQTVRTGILGPENPRFNPMRVLRNRVVREWAGRPDEVPVDTSAEPVIGHMELMGQPVAMHRFSNLVPVQDATTGDLEQMALPAGQGVGLITAVEPAAAVIAQMTADAAAMLDRYRPVARRVPAVRPGPASRQRPR
ncbi:MAG: nitronate monooxygenase [Micromonosporaceae bacterium]|nr:nitronate monooxygenase [Micromonosporaceae bacterium]